MAFVVPKTVIKTTTDHHNNNRRQTVVLCSQHRREFLAAATTLFLVTTTIDPALASQSVGDPFVVEDEDDPPYAPHEISTTSSDRALVLGRELSRLDAKMYGAFWCPHCTDHKDALGKQVFDSGDMTYIECSKDGVNSQTKLCRQKKLQCFSNMLQY